MATLKKRGDMWYSDLRLNGKRVQRALNSDKRIALGMLDDLVLVRRSQRNGDTPKNVSWNFFKVRYREFSDVNKESQTIYRDEYAFGMMEKSIPLQRLDQITPEFMERLKYKWQKDGRTLSVITRAIKSIKTAMRQAEAWKYIAPQPWHSVKVKEPQGRLHFFSIDELNALLRVCHGSWLTAAMVMSRAGLRRGEIFHMDWSDVDFKKGTLWVHEHPCDQCDNCRARKNVWLPKGHKERRVPMSQDLRAYLEALPERTGFVLGDDRPTLQSFDVYMRRLIKKAKLKGSAHTLRHTFASHMIAGGASLQEVAAILGHSSIKMTERYAHLAQDATQNAIKKLPQLASGLHPGSTAPDLLRVI